MSTSDIGLVITDPQNDFLSPDGVTWKLVGESVESNGTVEHLEQLLVAAKEAGTPVFVSPHYYYPHDDEWGFGGTPPAPPLWTSCVRHSGNGNGNGQVFDDHR